MRRAQTSVEYVLVISVLVVAVVAAAWTFAPVFDAAMTRLGRRTETVYTSGDLAR